MAKIKFNCANCCLEHEVECRDKKDSEPNDYYHKKIVVRAIKGYHCTNPKFYGVSPLVRVIPTLLSMLALEKSGFLRQF